jgi:mRNA turnover protein 4
VLRVALGREPEGEHRSGLCQLAERLRGDAGLVCTNLSVEELEQHLGDAAVAHYARAGQRADDTVVLEQGPLFLHGGSITFPHTQEPALRACGVPCRLRNGVVELLGEHTVCTEGQVLSAGAAQALRLLDVKLATFHMVLDSVWHAADGTFEVLSEPTDVAAAFDPDGEQTLFDDGGDFTVTEVEVPDAVYRQRQQQRVAAVEELEEDDGDDLDVEEKEGERESKRDGKVARRGATRGATGGAAAIGDAGGRPRRGRGGGAK